MNTVNEIIIDKCIENEMKFFVDEGNTHDIENRWFCWAHVIEMVMNYEFTKGTHGIILHHDGNRIEMEDDDFDIKEIIEGGGEMFYKSRNIMLVNMDETIFVNVK